MTNLVARFPGSAPGIIIVGGHYDTLSWLKHFVGANDGGSSTGLLLALAHYLRHHRVTGPSIWIVWFDGEEAIHSWTGDDHTYGSRYFVAHLSHSGNLKRLRAMINVDMIGDRSLDIARDTKSTPWLMNLACHQAYRLGFGSHFCHYTVAMDDDDSPFLRAGIPTLELIDFDYGPANSYWHTIQDSPNKLGVHSFQIIGAVVASLLQRLSTGSAENYGR